VPPEVGLTETEESAGSASGEPDSPEVVVVARGRAVPLATEAPEPAVAATDPGTPGGVASDPMTEGDVVSVDVANGETIALEENVGGVEHASVVSDHEDSAPADEGSLEAIDSVSPANDGGDGEVQQEDTTAGESVEKLTDRSEVIDAAATEIAEGTKSVDILIQGEETVSGGDVEAGGPDGSELAQSELGIGVDEEPAPVLTVGAVEQRQLQQIDTPLGKFRKWLGGSTQVGRPLKKEPEPQPSGAPDHQISEPPPAMSEQVARREMKTLKSSQRTWVTLIKDREDKAEAARQKIAHNEGKSKTLLEWVTNFDRSYQWRVQQRMDQQLQRAENDLRAYEQSAKNVEDFEIGRLSQLRQGFHRLLRQIFAVAVPVALITILIPVIFRIPRLDALETFYDPSLSAPIISLVVLAIIAGIFLFRRALGKNTIQNITLLKWMVGTIVVGLVIVLMPLWEDVLRDGLAPYLEENQNRIFIVLSVIVFLWVIIALTVYYRGWSQYRRAVDTQLAKLQAVISGYIETQQEVNRLGLLYQQTSEWLRILAYSLYRPWVTPAEWEDVKRNESEFRDFPFALRVAQVDDQVGAKSAELERIIASKLLVQGWRANAFRDLVDEVGKDMGFGGEKFSVEALDKDLPHQTNNTRNLLQKYLEQAALGVDVENTGEDTRTKYLVEVARKRLAELIDQTQSVALSAARPPVNQIISDPLDEIVSESGVLGGADESENWDGFLKESLGTEEVVQPPLSILNFTPDGQMNKVGESPQTFVLMPQRLAEALPNDVAKSVQLVPVSDNSSRAVEIIVRIDVVGPLKSKDIRLLSSSGSKVSAMSSHGKGASGLVAQLCQNCFDPTCPSSIDPAQACSSSGL
jgi:hypothetical protein